MGYVVKFVDEDRLPEDVHWALIRDGNDFYFVMKRTHVTPLALAEGWAAYRKAIRVPAPRPRLAVAR